jgi:hypothetical protein
MKSNEMDYSLLFSIKKRTCNAVKGICRSIGLLTVFLFLDEEENYVE